MELCDFGKRSGLKVAPVSIGAMRLPNDCLDSVELVRHAIDSGMKYIDTSRGYGESEFKLGRALRDGYREKVILSTKSSPWIKKIKDEDDGSSDSIRRRIDEALLRLDVDYLDFYQVWNINSPEAWENATKKGGMVDGIKQAMKEGLVRHTGFTTHEKPENLMEYLPQADWCEVVLISYNLLSRTYEEVLAKAHELGIGVIVMNPVGGGKLVEESPVLKKIAEEVGAESNAELAARYVLSNPNVDTILCGMTKLSDVDSTIAASEKPKFTADQIDRINEYFGKLSREEVKFCTNCGYCQPCPAGINIPGIMSALYDSRILGFKKAAERTYVRVTKDISPEACTKCGKCESICTQGLKIINELKQSMLEFPDQG